MRKPLLALTAAAFGIGTTEFIIMGLLPQLSESLHVSIPKAGTLVSAYALSVTCGSPVVAVALGKVDRRKALLGLMALFTLGNAACALAPGYQTLLAARILTALSHGSFFGIASVLAANIVPKNERAQAIALMFSGLTLANILGVPAGTALGLAFGWRMAFWALTPIGLAAMGLLFWLAPSQMPEPSHLLEELRIVLRLPVQITLALSTLSSVAMFCVLTYIAPMLEQVTHLSDHAVTWVLVIFGAGITVGNLLGGWLSDRGQMATILGGFTSLLFAFGLMPLALPYRAAAILAIFLWGLLHFATGAPLQPRVVEKAGGANLASTLNQSAFNLGNALGASLGGLALTRGAAYNQLPWISTVIILIALGLALFARRHERLSEGLGPAASLAAEL